MQSGAAVEECIARYATEIDATMVELLSGRIEAAKRLERNAEVLEGLEAL
jgi:hypothetical protein